MVLPFLPPSGRSPINSLSSSTDPCQPNRVHHRSVPFRSLTNRAHRTPKVSVGSPPSPSPRSRSLHFSPPVGRIPGTPLVHPGGLGSVPPHAGKEKLWLVCADDCSFVPSGVFSSLQGSRIQIPIPVRHGFACCVVEY